MEAKKYLWTTLMIIAWQTGFSQFGIKSDYSMRSFQGISLVHEQTSERVAPEASPVIGYGIDYWFRLRKIRMEFIPELNHTRYDISLLSEARLRVTQYSFYFNLLLYPFDWSNDCDCPTFSKEGGFLSKGFYVFLSPGVFLAKESALNESLLAESGVHFSGAAGIGLDFGLFNRITLSPELGLRYYPSYPGANLLTSLDLKRGYALEAGTPAIWQAFAGLRLRFRFDQ